MRQDLPELLIVFILNLLFLALVALLLWPLGQARLTFSLAQGYGVFWLVILISIALMSLIERLFRLSLDTHYNTYVALNLTVSALLVMGCSAFVALTLRSFAAGAPLWLAAILYGIGFLSSYVNFMVATSFYKEGIYKVVNLPLAPVSYLVFALWPAAGWVLYGWFFVLFGMSRI